MFDKLVTQLKLPCLKTTTIDSKKNYWQICQLTIYRWPIGNKWLRQLSFRININQQSIKNSGHPPWCDFTVVHVIILFANGNDITCTTSKWPWLIWRPYERRNSNSCQHNYDISNWKSGNYFLQLTVKKLLLSFGFLRKFSNNNWADKQLI